MKQALYKTKNRSEFNTTDNLELPAHAAEDQTVSPLIKNIYS